MGIQIFSEGMWSDLPCAGSGANLRIDALLFRWLMGALIGSLGEGTAV